MSEPRCFIPWGHLGDHKMDIIGSGEACNISLLSEIFNFQFLDGA